MMEMKTTLRLYCDDSHLVSSVWYHQCTATQFWSIVYKTATVKTTWIWRENGLPQQRFFFFFSQCVNYMCKGVTRGQSRPNDLKSSCILSLSYLLSLFMFIFDWCHWSKRRFSYPQPWSKWAAWCMLFPFWICGCCLTFWPLANLYEILDMKFSNRF